MSGDVDKVLIDVGVVRKLEYIITRPFPSASHTPYLFAITYADESCNFPLPDPIHQTIKPSNQQTQPDDVKV